ncbi:MAG TPA: bifunctional ornithine acetyltransferase/N-acetylglutamate synthase [Polyangiaceae bacterium]|nr:bifunctional ornithine acetyltransferase/N-acetylglutamate synthase [Polyangiaceae bacterium]
MSTTNLVFASREEHLSWLATEAQLPQGFRVGSAALSFLPVEVPKPSRMTLSLLALDRPTEAFAAMFTRNAVPGAPVRIGRERVKGQSIGAIVVNTKVSNVGAPGGVQASERVAAATARLLGFEPQQVLPSSTGVIGWRLPVDEMIKALPAAISSLQPYSVLPAAQGIMTTDLYPKLRSVAVGSGRVVGIAKGAGMIEPNLATMLVFLLTDLALPREVLRDALSAAVDESFHSMTIDTDTSTSDSVVLLSSQRVPCPDEEAFRRGLTQVCQDLAEDIVRNGEGVHHVVRVNVSGAPNAAFARGVGKAVVSSPLFQCAVCGNDPNVGRLAMAVGKFVGSQASELDLSRCSMRVGGHLIFSELEFRLDPTMETKLIAHLKAAELYESAAPEAGVFRPPVNYPPHERSVEIDIHLGAGQASASVVGSDRSHEYISENADYRS